LWAARPAEQPPAAHLFHSSTRDSLPAFRRGLTVSAQDAVQPQRLHASDSRPAPPLTVASFIDRMSHSDGVWHQVAFLLAALRFWCTYVWVIAGFS